MACAAALMGLAASAHASIPVKMAPASSQANYVPVTVARVIIVEYVVFAYEYWDLPVGPVDQLSHVDQAAEFDRTA